MALTRENLLFDDDDIINYLSSQILIQHSIITSKKPKKQSLKCFPGNVKGLLRERDGSNDNLYDQID